MFFDKFKVVLKNRREYLEVNNHIYDVLHSSIKNINDNESYPLYMIGDDVNNISLTDKKTFEKFDAPKININMVMSMKYILSYHFIERFHERFENVTHRRLKKILSDMLKRGTWLKRRDSFQLVKYKKTSDYVLFSKYVGGEKIHYMIILTNGNILTTIYEFDIKELKFFKES